MKKILSACIISACLLLSACGTIREPVVAKTNRGDIFTGEVVASMTDGSFYAADKKGLNCQGKYDQFSTKRTLTIYVSCSDGAHGLLVSHRDPSLMGGVGSGTLSDGTKFTFKFGPKINSEPDK